MLTPSILRLPDDFISQRICTFCAAQLAVFESPIERMFLAAIYYAGALASVSSNPKISFDAYAVKNLSESPSIFEQTHIGCGREIYFSAHFPIDRFEADFVAIAMRNIYADEQMLEASAKSKTIIIECDGHDFHERTKEQARHDRSRDRFMQERGHIVLRFTGSEIYKDSLACVDQVSRVAVKDLASVDSGW